MADASVARRVNVKRTPIWCARLPLAMPAGDAAFPPAMAIDVIAAGECKGAWNDDELVRRIPGEAAFRPLSEGDRPIAS